MMEFTRPRCCDWHYDGGDPKLGCSNFDVMSQSYYPSGITIGVSQPHDKVMP